MNKKKENESVHYIDVFSINKYFYLYNYDLNKILNFFQKENVQKLSNKETSKNYNDNEFKNKDIRKNKGFVLKFTSTFGVAKFIQDTADKKISSKFYLIYEINAFVINEIKILINAASLNKSFFLNLIKRINDKNNFNNIDGLLNKRIKMDNSIHNKDNNNYDYQKLLLIYLIKYFYFILQNTNDYIFKSNHKKFSNLEVSKNNKNFSFYGNNKNNNKLFKIEKSEFKIYGKNIIFPELIEIKPKGIINKYGCCYLNAAIQCFYHCSKVTSFFILNKEIILKAGGPISLGYLEVVEELSKNKNNYISIKNFRNLLIKNDESFIGNDGNDSKDVILLQLLNICFIFFTV